MVVRQRLTHLGEISCIFRQGLTQVKLLTLRGLQKGNRSEGEWQIGKEKGERVG